ncbi:hypothetical protein J26TS2_09450 [Shouchella clausii]|nr:hypothetical protein J26TS2_09450 [Shouchella clausii]
MIGPHTTLLIASTMPLKLTNMPPFVDFFLFKLNKFSLVKLYAEVYYKKNQFRLNSEIGEQSR